jgi:glycosyltransferase 2 family protein
MRRLWPWLRLLIGVGILVALAWQLGTGAFVDGLRMISFPSILVGLGVGFLTIGCAAWRWCLVARRLGLPLTLWTAVLHYYRSILLNSVLPAGVLGDVHRAVSHGQRSGDVGRGVRAVVLERIAGQAVLMAVGAAVLLTQPTLESRLAVDIAPTPGVVIAVLCAVVAVAALVAWALWGRSRSGWRRAIATTLADARVGLLSRNAWPGVVLLSVGAVAGNVALLVVSARVAGSPASVAQLLPLMVLALVVMGLPINIGGWGPREAFLAVAFGAVGLGAAQGLTTAVVYGVLALVGALPGVVVLLVHRPGLRRQDRQVGTE